MELEQPQQHEMTLVATHDTGAEEWYCPACGRRFLMHWPPEYKKIVLEAGDENAIHSGGKGGLRIGPPQVLQQEQLTEVDVSEVDEPDVHDPNLIAWEQWMDEVNFESWWSRDLQ